MTITGVAFEPRIRSTLKDIHKHFSRKLEQYYQTSAELAEPIEGEAVELGQGEREVERFIVQQYLGVALASCFNKACANGLEEVVDYCLKHDWPFARAWKNEVRRMEGAVRPITLIDAWQVDLAATPLWFAQEPITSSSGGKTIVPTRDDVLAAATAGHWPLVCKLLETGRGFDLKFIELAIESAPTIEVLESLFDKWTSTIDVPFGSSERRITTFSVRDGMYRAAFQGRLDNVKFTFQYFNDADTNSSFLTMCEAAHIGDLNALDTVLTEWCTTSTLWGGANQDEHLLKIPLYLAAAQNNGGCVRRLLLERETLRQVFQDDRIISKHELDHKGVREFVLKVLGQMIVQQNLPLNELRRLYTENQQGGLGAVPEIQSAFHALESAHYIQLNQRSDLLHPHVQSLDAIKQIERFREELVRIDPLSEEWKIGGTDALLDKLSLQADIRGS